MTVDTLETVALDEEDGIPAAVAPTTMPTYWPAAAEAVTLGRRSAANEDVASADRVEDPAPTLRQVQTLLAELKSAWPAAA